jgi:hypothetical protein
MVAHDMVRVGLEDHPLTATAALVWNGDLPRPLQQILLDAVGGIARRRRPSMPSRSPAVGLRARVWLDRPVRRTTAISFTPADGSRT